MCAIIKKELTYYFTSTVGYVFFAVFTFMGGWFFVTSNLISLNGDIGLIFSNMLSAFLFIIPLLTMNLFASERKYGTDKLLCSLPLSVADIVLGKFFAVLIIYLAALVTTCIYPVLLSRFSSPDFGVFAGNLTGFLLMGTALISIGVFISTITAHQIAAAILTFAVVLILYLLDWISPAFSGTYSKFVVDFFAVSKRFRLFSEGFVNLSDVIYYLSITVLFIFLSVVRQKKEGSATAKIAVALTVLTFFSLNVFADFLCERYMGAVELNSSHLSELTEETKILLDSIDEEVCVYSFIPEEESDGVLITIDELLKKYNRYSDNITYKKIDAASNPDFVKQYVDMGSTVSLYSVVFECRDNFKVVNVADAVSFNSDSGTLENIMAEQFFSSAIISVTSKENIKVAMVTGHGERISPDVLADVFELNNYKFDTVNLLTDNIEDKKMLILTTPQTDYSEAEIDKLDGFLKNGGAAQIFIGPEDVRFENLQAYLREWGIELSGGYLVDNSKGNYVQSKKYLLPEINDTEITKNFAGKGFNLMVPYARSVNIHSVDGIQSTILLETSEKARLKKDISSTTATKEDGDTDGKFKIAAYLTESFKDDVQSGIMVVGSTAFVDSDYINQSSFINREFILQSAAHLTKNEKFVNISPKKIGNTLLNVSASDVIRMAVLTMLLIPLLFAALGVIVRVKRRKM